MAVRRPLVRIGGKNVQLPAGDVISGQEGYFRTEPIAATATGQTSFTVPGGYTPGAIFVSLNGATLPPADFTATNGTTVVLESGEGVVAGSVLLVHVLSAFEVADALPLGGTAADSSKLGGQLPSYYATQESINVDLVNVRQAGDQPIPNATATKLLFQTVLDDSSGIWSSVNSRLVPTKAGLYQISASAAVKHLITDGGKRCILSVYKNGAIYANLAVFSTTNSAGTGASGSVIVPMNGAGDYIEVFFRQDIGSEKLTDSPHHATYLQAIFLGGQ